MKISSPRQALKSIRAVVQILLVLFRRNVLFTLCKVVQKNGNINSGANTFYDLFKHALGLRH
jgi:hypothetical protein